MYCFTLDNLYSDEEIASFRSYVTNADSKNHTFTNADFKNGKIKYPELSELMYKRTIQHIPKLYTDTRGIKWKPIGCPDYIMYASIEPGQSFGIHTDTGCVYDENNKQYSKFTVITYLNHDFDGGSLRFYTDEFKHTSTIDARTNRTLVFDIDLFHGGEPVVGGTKQWIGTEIVCEKVET